MKLRLPPKEKRPLLWAWIWVALWMGLIFFFSAQPGSASASLSSGITKFLFQALETFLPGLAFDLQALHLFIRKNTHFFLYLILDLLVLRALLKSRDFSLKNLALAFLISVLYAALDETHQLFVPGRAGQIRDVFIDAAGALLGIALYGLHFYRRKKKQAGARRR